MKVLKVKSWTWNSEAFQFKYPQPDEWVSRLNSVNSHVENGMQEIMEWISVTKAADFFEDNSLRREILINGKVFQICIVMSKNKQVFLGFSFDKQDNIFYLMSLWLKGQLTEGDFLAIAETEITEIAGKLS